ncbi:MAG: glycosyltransferase, partial [Planctomycetota bacterium]
AALSGCDAVHAAADAFKLFGLLRKTRRAVVHLHLYTALLPAVLACRAAGAPCVAHLHIPLRDWNARHRFAWRTAVRGANHICGVAKDVLRSVGHSDGDGRATLVPPPIPLPEPAPARPPHRPDSPFVVAGVGRLADQKDWPTLLRALPQVRQDVEKAGRTLRFLHAGGGEKKEEFHALVRSLDLTDVVDARGAIPHAQVAEILDAADLFVLPSRFEGLGIAPLEAMARGVPTVTADYPAADDYIVGPPGAETGRTFPRGDAAACAEQIRWHLRNPRESAALGQRGRTFVAKNFIPAVTFGKLPAIYDSLAN